VDVDSICRTEIPDFIKQDFLFRISGSSKNGGPGNNTGCSFYINSFRFLKCGSELSAELIFIKLIRYLLHNKINLIKIDFQCASLETKFQKPEGIIATPVNLRSFECTNT